MTAHLTARDKLSPAAQRANQKLYARGELRANSSADTLNGLKELEQHGLAVWSEERRRWLSPSYAVAMLRELLLAGPYEGEDFFRVKATGNGETKWFNVSPEKLAKIADVLAEEI